jgi:hypothetical protein
LLSDRRLVMLDWPVVAFKFALVNPTPPVPE